MPESNEGVVMKRRVGWLLVVVGAAVGTWSDLSVSWGLGVVVGVGLIVWGYALLIAQPARRPYDRERDDVRWVR